VKCPTCLCSCAWTQGPGLVHDSVKSPFLQTAIQFSDTEVEAQCGVADDLVEVARGELVVADVSQGGPRRGVDVEAGVFAELADAEEMGRVGDDDDVMEIVFAGDGGKAVDLLLGVDGAGLGDDAAERNSICEEVVAADASFGVARVFIAAAAEGDDERGDVFAVEFDGVIEAGVKDGRGAAGVLGCAEDGDSVGGLGVVFAGDGGYLLIDPETPCGSDYEDDREEPAEEDTSCAASAVKIGGWGDHL